MKYFIILFFLFGAFSLQAQEKKDLSEMSLEELMNVSVSGVSKYKQQVNRAPASIIVITEQQIRANGYFDLSDILKDLPAVDMVDNARAFGEFYTIRGIEGNDRFLVLIDGQKLNPVSGTFLSVGNSISVRIAKRVEIIFGPASAIYGADAFAGIINIITRDVRQDFSADAYLAYGSWNSIDAGAEFTKKITPNLSLSLFARIFKSDGPDLTERDTIYNTIKDYTPPLKNKFEQPINDHNILVKAAYKNITFSWFRQQFDEGNAFGLYPQSYIYNKENKWKLVTNILWTEYEQPIATGNLSANLAYVSHVQDPETQFFKTRANYAYDETYSQYLTGKDHTLRGGISYFTLLNQNLEMIAGLEYEHTESVPPYANDQVFASSIKYEGREADLIDETLTLKESRYAGFSQITYKPLKELDIIGGLRYDYSSRYKGTTNPRIGLIARPFSTTTVKALYGTAFQAPSLFFQYEQWGSSGAVMLSVDELQQTNPGWELKNQRIKTYDFSIEHNFTDNFKLTISIYHHFLTDLIERVIYTDAAYNKYFSSEDTTVYSLGFRNENIGKQNIRGINVSLYAKINGCLSGYAYYSYCDAAAQTNGDELPVPRIAKNKFWLGVSCNNLFNYLTLSGRYKWIGRINNRNESVFPNGTQPGYSTLDLSLSVNNVVEHTRFFARFENILDSHIEHGGLYDQVFYMPTAHQPGFSGRIGLEFNY